MEQLNQVSDEILSDYKKYRDDLHKKVYLSALALSICCGIFASLIFASKPEYSTEYKALLIIAATIFPMSCVAIYSHFAHLSAIQRSQEFVDVVRDLKIGERVDKSLASLFFFVRHTEFENALRWLSKTDSYSVNFLVGKIIKQLLDRSFEHNEKNVMRIPVGSQTTHSIILNDLLPGSKKVCFTCNLSPRNWFLICSQSKIAHEPFFEKSVKLPFDRQRFVHDGILEEYIGEYPSHYIRFLEDAKRYERRRVFLLDSVQWSDLISRENEPYFTKFVAPCELSNVQTRFVNLEKLENISTISEDRSTAYVVSMAIQNNVTKKDYEIFEGSACMVYRDGADDFSKDPVPKPEILPVLEFVIGDRIKIYSDFLDKVFSLDVSWGVYSASELRSEFLS